MTPSSIIPAARHAERRHQGAAGSQAPLPWQLPQNVSDSDDPAAAESAPNADLARLKVGVICMANPTHIGRLCAWE